MPKEIILSRDSDPKSPKYLTWNMDEYECQNIKAAIGELEDNYPLLSTLSDFYEDFECPSDRLLALCQETIDLQINLEEHHRETAVLLKLLTMMGGLAALAHDHGLCIYGYSE
jgi:hypothetical protein